MNNKQLSPPPRALMHEKSGAGLSVNSNHSRKLTIIASVVFIFASFGFGGGGCKKSPPGSSDDPWSFSSTLGSQVWIQNTMPIQPPFDWASRQLSSGTHDGSDYRNKSCFFEQFPIFYGATFFNQALAGGDDLTKNLKYVFIRLVITPNKGGKAFTAKTFWWPAGKPFNNNSMTVSLPNNGYDFLCEATLFEVVTRCSLFNSKPGRRYITINNGARTFSAGSTIQLDFRSRIIDDGFLEQ